MQGQATAISRDQAIRIKRAFLLPSHRLIFAIGWHTTERWGAIVQLRVSDCYRNPAKREPMQVITIPARIRKDSKTRQIEVSEDLAAELRAYQPPLEPGAYLFPGNRDGSHLCWRAASEALKRATARVGLDGLGIRTHSTRRGAITTMARSGIHQRVIQSITGHANSSALARYIDVSEEQRLAAIATL